MSDGGPGERWFMLVRSAVCSSSCWLKRAKEVMTVDAGPSPSSSQSNGSQRRFVASVTTEAAALQAHLGAAIGGTKRLCRLSLPVFTPPGI